MGIGYDNLLGLLKMKREGVDLSRVATLGRYYLFCTPKEVIKAFKKFDHSLSNREAETIFSNAGRGENYQETLLEYLGAKEIVSFDVSDYEHCTVVHDFGKPLPQKFHGNFSCVLDFGSAEHIFNFPQVMANLVNLCEVGGHIIMDTPYNNMAGHGFFQFSPELFLPLFSDINGLELKNMFVTVFRKNFTLLRLRSQWYEVIVHGRRPARIQVCQGYPSQLFVCAKKTASIDHLEVAERYYDAMYREGKQEGQQEGVDSKRSAALVRVKQLKIIAPVRHFCHGVRFLSRGIRYFGRFIQRRASKHVLSREFFKRVDISRAIDRD